MYSECTVYLAINNIGYRSNTCVSHLALGIFQYFFYFTITDLHCNIQGCFSILKNANCMSSDMWGLLLVLENEPLCIVVGSCNGTS